MFILRKTLIVFMFAISTVPAKSQIGYLFGDLLINMFTTWEEGGYEMKYTSMNGSPLYLHGVRGGWFIGNEQKSLIGMSTVIGLTTINEYSALRWQQISMVYGTIYYEHNFRLTQNIQWSPSLHVGMGAVGIDQYQVSSENNVSAMYLLEPNVNLSMRILPIVKIGVGAGYRLLSGVHLQGGDNISLGGPSANIYLKFGNYRDEIE
jgi:hypothetical protein